MPFNYALCRFVFEFHINQIDDDVMVSIVHISNFTESTNFIFATNIQQHKIHLMIKVQVTLTKAEGQSYIR